MKKLRRAYDLWDFPGEEQAKTPPAPLAPQPKVRKKPGPKPRVEPVIAPSHQEISQRGPDFLIKNLINGVRKFFVNVDIREPKPRIVAPNQPPVSYVSNIILDGQRVGMFEQPIEGGRVYLKFDKSQNVPIWHEGDEPEVMADKIKHEIEKNYTKKLAAKLGYRVAIKMAAHRRRIS